jgi:hypothetical protein
MPTNRKKQLNLIAKNGKGMKKGFCEPAGSSLTFFGC